MSAKKKSRENAPLCDDEGFVEVVSTTLLVEEEVGPLPAAALPAQPPPLLDC